MWFVFYSLNVIIQSFSSTTADETKQFSKVSQTKETAQSDWNGNVNIC